MKPQKPKPRKSLEKITSGDDIFVCQGKFCSGYSASSTNRLDIYYLSMFDTDGNILAYKSAWLCKICSDANRKFFNDVYRL